MKDCCSGIKTVSILLEQGQWSWHIQSRFGVGANEKKNGRVARNDAIDGSFSTIFTSAFFSVLGPCVSSVSPNGCFYSNDFLLPSLHVI